MRILMVEPTRDLAQRGSIGCHYVARAARSMGHAVDLNPDKPADQYDVELVSVHHPLDFLMLPELPRRAPIRLIGGHPMQQNPRPVIPYADAVCVGEGEEWIVEALTALESDRTAGALREIDGAIICSDFTGEVPASRQVNPVPKNPAYLNRASRGGRGHADVWYLEMARGCPFSCHYCELGWSMKYRAQDTGWLIDQIDHIDRERSNHVTLFAPDEASHPGYHQILDRIHERKLITAFGSMRLDRIMKQDLPLKRNMLIRVGLDGLTEETRMRVAKRIKDQDVVDYFEFMSERGHSNFKMFMVFGYPWETVQNFDEWEFMMAAVLSIPRRVNAHLRIKFTPFIPQPSTPLADVESHYDHELVERILGWFHRHKAPPRHPGWYVESDGILSERWWRIQCELTRGNVDAVLDVRDRYRLTERSLRRGAMPA